MSPQPLPAVSRLGIVAKSHLRAATPHLVDIGTWLAARNVQAVFETATAALMPESAPRAVASKEELAANMDMVLVLGGDGTLLSMADRIGEAGIADSHPWRELRQPGFSHGSDAGGAVRGARRGCEWRRARRRTPDAEDDADARGPRLRRTRRAERRGNHEDRALADDRPVSVGRRRVPHSRQSRRADHRDADRLDRLQHGGRRSDRPAERDPRSC